MSRLRYLAKIANATHGPAIFACLLSSSALSQTTLSINAGEQAKIPIQITADIRCNIEIEINGKREGRIIEPPNFSTIIEYLPVDVGAVEISWKGKQLFRGLRSAPACPSEGRIKVNVVANNTQKLNEWTRLLDNLPPGQSECVVYGLKYRGIQYVALVPDSKIDSPSLPSVQNIVQRCAVFARINIRDTNDGEEIACIVDSEPSRCRGVFLERTPNGQSQSISMELAVQRHLDGRPWETGRVELPHARDSRLSAKKDREERAAIERNALRERLLAEQREREQRAALERTALEERMRIEKAESEERLKAAAAARLLAEEQARIAKLAADEKERAWKASPEYRALQEEQARKQAEELRLAQEKADKERMERHRIEQTELERRRQADAYAKLKKEEEERTRLQQEEEQRIGLRATDRDLFSAFAANTLVATQKFSGRRVTVSGQVDTVTTAALDKSKVIIYLLPTNVSSKLESIQVYLSKSAEQIALSSKVKKGDFISITCDLGFKFEYFVTGENCYHTNSIGHDNFSRSANEQSDSAMQKSSSTGRSLRDELLNTRWILARQDRLCERQSGSFTSYSVDYGRVFTIRGRENRPPKKPRVDIEEKNFNEVVISVTMYGTDQIERLLQQSPVEAAYIEYHLTRGVNGNITERVKTRILDTRRIFDRVITYVDQPEESSNLEKCEQQ